MTDAKGNVFWNGRRCLVTGGAGFGGSHLCEQLLNRGANVYVLDRICPDNSYLALSGLKEHVSFIQGDIRDLEMLKYIFDRFQIQTVFHLAAQPGVPMSIAMPYETLSINTMGTYAVLEAARTAGSFESLVFASTGGYYGTTFGKEPISEDAPPRVSANLYCPSKAAGDIAVRCYAKTFNMNAAVCRFINTYGPGNTNLTTIVPRAIANLLDGLPYDFGSRDDGSTTFDYLHIRDMVRGYIAVAENMDRAKGEAFNFSGGNPVSVRDLVRLISALYDGREREPLFHGAPREVPVFKRLDSTKARKMLGWDTSISLEKGLRETVLWYERFWPQIKFGANHVNGLSSSLVTKS